MIDPIFVLKRLRNTNYRNWLVTAKRLGKELHRSSLVVFADMIHCTIKYGAGYVDYDTLKMYDMTETERNKINTIGRNNALVKELNQKDKIYLFDDKPSFNAAFKDYVKREWMVLDDSNFGDFCKFCEGKDAVVAKPVDQSCGAGIKKVDLKAESEKSEGSKGENGENDVAARKAYLEDIYNKLLAEGAVLIEELIVQDETMSKLCSTSVNTIRISTIRNGEDVTLINSVVRMGREGTFVDNLNYGGYGAGIGGLAALVDCESGELIMPAFDKNRNHYETVPVLGTDLRGFVIPRWDEVIEFVKSAAKVVDEVRFVGWDVCISRDRGLLLVEGNYFPGNDLQVPERGIGTYDVIMKALGRNTW